MSEQEQTEDAKVFGENRFVFCAQHHRVHSTGWCTVSVREKTLLESNDWHEASLEAKIKGLK